MAAAKTVSAVIVGVAGLGALGFGLAEGAVARRPATVAPLAVALRPIPAPSPTAAAPVEPASPQVTPEPPAAVVDAGAPTPDAGAPVVAKAVPDGRLNLRASDKADVFVDGKKAGMSPLEEFWVKAGKHKVRFDCFDAAGNTLAGSTQTVEVKPGEETLVDYTCPLE